MTTEAATTKTVDILRYAELPDFTDKRLSDHFTVHDITAADDHDAFLAEVADKIRGVATTGADGIPGDVIRKLPNLEIVSCFAVGVDAVDVAACKEVGAIVTNTPDVLNECVADLAMGLTIDVLRQITTADRYVRAGEWTGFGSFPLSRSLKGKTMGILGLGRIGLNTAERAQGFGMKIAYHNRSKRDDVDFAYHDTAAGLARASDVLVVLCPGGPATRNIVNAEVLDALGPDGYLISISRGSCVDEPALVEYLADNRIAGAGIDVFVDEPNVPAKLKTLENVVLAPHMGSGTVETRTAMGDLMIDNLIAHFSGKKVLTPVA